MDSGGIRPEGKHPQSNDVGENRIMGRISYGMFFLVTIAMTVAVYHLRKKLW